MPYKDRPDIPLPVLRALKSDRYDTDMAEHLEDLPEGLKNRFSHTISVTTLSRAPRQRILFKRHAEEIEVDPEERSHALLGRVVHTILMDYKEPHQIVEERLGIIIDVTLPDGRKINVYLNGAADLYDPIEQFIQDYKTPKTGSLLYDKSDFHAQLNVLGYIWRKRGFPVTKLFNSYLLLKDYDKRKVQEGKDYPATRFPVYPVPLWTDEVCEKYIMGRLIAHFSNEGNDDTSLDFCSPAERWQSDPKYGVYKLDEAGIPQRTAKYWATSMTEANDKVIELEVEDWAKIVEKNNALVKPKPESVILLKKAKFIVKEIPSEPRRCGLCDVAPYCNQRIAELSAQLPEPEPELYLNDL